MSVLFDTVWIWIVLSFLSGCCGFAWYVNNQKFYAFIIAFLMPILILALGLSLYFGVDTDRKAIQRTLDSLVAAVGNDDFAKVSQLMTPKADGFRQFAHDKMKIARISRVKYRNLQIEINDAPSPPLANVQFSAIFYWKTKSPIMGFSVDEPLPENARFELEMVKTKSRSWLVTDKYQWSLSSVP